VGYTPLKYVVSAFVWLVLAVTAPVEVLVGAVLFLVSRPFDPDRRLVHALICHWNFLYLRLVPTWKVRVEGRELLPKQGACVLVANHQSMADVLALMGLFHPFKYVSKASLFQLPLVGWLMRMAGYVALVRGRHGSIQTMMTECRKWLRRGMPVLLFPEGTYSEGGKMLPFKRGAFQLAIDEQVPVVPVVLQGTTSLIEGDGPWMSPRCAIRVKVLPPLQPAEMGDDAEALALTVRGRIEEVLR